MQLRAFKLCQHQKRFPLKKSNTCLRCGAPVGCRFTTLENGTANRSNHVDSSNIHISSPLKMWPTVQIKNIPCITHQLTLRLQSLFELRCKSTKQTSQWSWHWCSIFCHQWGNKHQLVVAFLYPLSQASPGTAVENIHRRTYLPEGSNSSARRTQRTVTDVEPPCCERKRSQPHWKGLVAYYQTGLVTAFSLIVDSWTQLSTDFATLPESFCRWNGAPLQSSMWKKTSHPDSTKRDRFPTL